MCFQSAGPSQKRFKSVDRIRNEVCTWIESYSDRPDAEIVRSHFRLWLVSHEFGDAGAFDNHGFHDVWSLERRRNRQAGVFLGFLKVLLLEFELEMIGDKMRTMPKLLVVAASALSFRRSHQKQQ